MRRDVHKPLGQSKLAHPDRMQTRVGLRLQDDKKPLGVLQLTDTGGGVFKSAAVAILRRERRLLTTGEITK